MYRVTEEMIAGASLSSEEEKVLRSFWGLPLDKKDEEWVQSINGRKFEKFFLGAMRKVRDSMAGK